MNDPTYVEAARALAQRALLEGGREVDGRIAYAFRLATARRPSAEETAVLRTLLSQATGELPRATRRPQGISLQSANGNRDPKLDVTRAGGLVDGLRAPS